MWLIFVVLFVIPISSSLKSGALISCLILFLFVYILCLKLYLLLCLSISVPVWFILCFAVGNREMCLFFMFSILMREVLCCWINIGQTLLCSHIFSKFLLFLPDSRRSLSAWPITARGGIAVIPCKWQLMKMVFPLITLCLWGGRGFQWRSVDASMCHFYSALWYPPVVGKLSVLVFFPLLSTVQQSGMNTLLLWLYQAHAQLASHGRWEPFWKHFSLHLITGAQRGGNMKQIRGVKEREGERKKRREGW